MRKVRSALPTLGLIVVLVLIAGLPVSAEPSVLSRPIVIGQAGGVANAVAYQSGNLYFSVGPRLARAPVQASDPGHPLIPPVYTAILPGIPEDIKIANNYLYLALGTAGIAILDPTSMRLVNFEELPDHAFGINFDFELAVTDVAVDSRYLYAAVGKAGIVVYDLGSSQDRLTFVQAKTFLNPVRNITDVEVQLPVAENGFRKVLYVAANNYAVDPAPRGGVMRFDITDTPALGIPDGLAAQIEVNALDIALPYVFAAGQTNFYVLDPATLSIRNSDFPLVNPAVELALSPQARTAYLLSPIGIDVLDLATPTDPKSLTTTPFSTLGAAMHVAAESFGDDGDVYLYVADFDAGLSIVRSPHTAPGVLEMIAPSYVVPSLSIVRAVAGDRLQAFGFGSSEKLWRADGSTPSSLRFAGSGVTPPVAINAMIAHDSWLLAAAGTSGLLRYALHSNADPSDQQLFTTGGTAVDLALAWPNVVVADGTHGLVLVNVDGDLQLTGTAPAPQFNSNFRSVDVAGNYAYVIDGNGTFRVYDLTDPNGPIALGTLALKGMLAVAAHGSYAFVACGEDGLRVIDASDPNALKFVGTEFYETADLAQSVEVYGDFLYVAVSSAGVQMLAIQPDGQLFPVTTIDVPGNTLSVSMGSDGFLYTASENGGLAMIQFDDFRLYFPIIGQRGPMKRYLPFIGR